MRPTRARKRCVALALAGVCILALAGCSDESLRVPGGNLIFISIDTTRSDHLSLYGYERPTTPNLDRFAADAIVFDNAVSAAPSTAPSHMAMMTGIYPTIHGVRNFGLGKSGQEEYVRRKLADEFSTLAEILRSNGYATAAFTGGGNVAGILGFDRGFDRYEERASGLSGMNWGMRVDPEPCLEWIREAAGDDRPFFAFLHTYIPHAPYVPPPEWANRFEPEDRGRIPDWDELFSERRKGDAAGGATSRTFWESVDRESSKDVPRLLALYDEEILYADDLLKRLIEGFREIGLDRDTVLLVTSDHGEEFREHGGWEHHSRVWEELLRVPMMLLLPSTRGNGRRVPYAVSGLEIFPTLLDLLGIPVHAQAAERSLVGRLEGTETWDDHPIVSEFLGSTRDLGQGRWSPYHYIRAVRQGRFKLIQESRGGHRREDLYDLQADPGERASLFGDRRHTDTLTELRRVSDQIDLRGMRLRNPLGDARPSDEVMEQLRSLGYVK